MMPELRGMCRRRSAMRSLCFGAIIDIEIVQIGGLVRFVNVSPA